MSLLELCSKQRRPVQKYLNQPCETMPQPAYKAGITPPIRRGPKQLPPLEYYPQVPQHARTSDSNRQLSNAKSKTQKCASSKNCHRKKTKGQNSDHNLSEHKQKCSQEEKDGLSKVGEDKNDAQRRAKKTESSRRTQTETESKKDEVENVSDPGDFDLDKLKMHEVEKNDGLLSSRRDAVCDATDKTKKKRQRARVLVKRMGFASEHD